MYVAEQRCPAETFERHLKLLQNGALDEDLEVDYSPDVVLISSQGIFRGCEAIRRHYRVLGNLLIEPTYFYRTRRIEGDTAFLEWSAWGEGEAACEGVDTYVFRAGAIAIQTVHYDTRRRLI